MTTQETNKIITVARNFLKERTGSLKKDCKHCLFKDHPAPFPALLYCFATIDLLGALYAGNASDNAHPTIQAKDYMTGIMKYPEETAELLQKVFRHKLVHLAQPNPIIKYNGKQYSWWECHESQRQLHLKIEPVNNKNNIFVFRIIIWNFVEDIIDSVWGANGYFYQLLKNTGNMQENFMKAHKIITGI